ncbi:hypothetical protein ABZ832_20000 [Streptantibioticus parmotrematis]|uniref:hypothetical protein n=1 Tax=Streptantibioticus parmotrematis TaxID=2873249 RepID=UPI0033F41E9E
MPRSLRFLLVWLSCTALTVTAVFLAVRFVVGSTSPLPPTAPAMPSALADASASPEIGTAVALPSRSAPVSPSSHPAPPSPSPSHRSPSPHPSSAPPSQGYQGSDCDGGVGVHTVQSVGGQVTVRMGSNAVCLISAVPAQGFTTSTDQSGPDTLEVTFSSSDHRSEITASIDPEARLATRETSW